MAAFLVREYPIQKSRHGASSIKGNRLAILWLGYPPDIKSPNIIWISFISLISGEFLLFAIFAHFCSKLPTLFYKLLSYMTLVRLNRKIPLNALDADLRRDGLTFCLTRFHAEEQGVTPDDLGRRR